MWIEWVSGTNFRKRAESPYSIEIPCRTLHQNSSLVLIVWSWHCNSAQYWGEYGKIFYRKCEQRILASMEKEYSVNMTAESTCLTVYREGNAFFTMKEKGRH